MVETFEESVAKQSEVCDELLVDKQRDYGPGNILAFGEFGILVRANDKINRLINLLKKEHVKEWLEKNEPEILEKHKTELEPQFEAIEDTWMDLRNYPQIALMLRAGEFDLPLSNRQLEYGFSSPEIKSSRSITSIVDQEAEVSDGED